MLALPSRLLLALIAIGCTVQIWLNLNAGGTNAVFAKMSASTGFVLLALASGALHTRYGKAILCGMCLSWFGDLLLAGGTETLFLAGLVAFLCGHLAYVWAFVAHGVVWKSVGGSLAGVAVVSGTVATGLFGFIPPHMTIPVLVYIVVISVMVATSIGARFAGGVLLMPLGAVMFYVSDLAVAIEQFVKPDFPNYVWGLPLYFGGQALLALSVAGAPRAQTVN